MFFIIEGKTFIKFTQSNADGLTQTYTSYLSLKHLLQNLFNGKGISTWTWALGLGGDTFEYYGFKLFNPLTYFIIAFPDNLIDVGYSIANVLREYLAGLTFYLCLREVKLGSIQRIIGAITYAFSGWMVEVVLNQGSFENAAIIFPLLIMGTERIFKKKSPVLFIISVALCVATGVLWTYISGIFVVIYYLARYHDYNDRDLEKFAKNTLQYVLYGVIGILISAPFVLSIICSMTGATTDTQAQTNLCWYPIEKYLSIPEGMFKYTEVGATSYSYIFVSVVCVCLMPLVLISIKKKKSTIAWLALILSVLSLVPVTSKVLNGLSYPAGRWYFVLVFFVIWATMECLNKEYISEQRNIKAMRIWIIILAATTIILYAVGLGNKKAAIAAVIGLILGIIFIQIVPLFFKEGKSSSKLILIGIIIFVISLAYPIIGKTYSGNGYLNQYLGVGESSERLNTSSERIAPELATTDKSFYRIDQAYRINKNTKNKLKTNANLVFNSNSIYTYSSLVDSKWSEFNKILGNNYGCFSRTMVVSNDNRPVMDFLLGVKYYLGDNKYEKSSTRYAGYGYEKFKKIEDVEVLKNDYSIGLGTAINQYITESELMEYPKLVRDQVMLQAVVIPDDEIDKVSGIKHAEPEDIETQIYELENKVIRTKKNTKLSKHTIKVKGKKGKIVFKRQRKANTQIILSLQGIERIGENKEDQGQFRLIARSKGLKKYAYCEKGSPRGFNDIEDYNLNMGRNENISGTIRLSIRTPGTYKYDAIKLYAIPMDVLEDNAAKLQETSFQVKEFDRNKSTVSAKVKAKGNSILYLSIPYDKGWKAYVDGKEVETIENVNIAFTGVKLSSGYHNISLTYSHWGMKVALIGTVIGAISLLIVILYWRKKVYEKA